MHKKSALYRGIVKPLAISFFFACIFIVFAYFIFEEPIRIGINVINKFSYEQTKEHNTVVKLDTSIKRIENIPAYGEVWAELRIPKIDRELPIYQGDSLKLLRYGLGHPQGGFFPGEGNTIVVAGHNSKQYFQLLPDLNSGDKIIIDAVYGVYEYSVVETKVVDKNDSSALPYDTGKELLILYTCFPTNSIGLTNQRFVVYAELVGEKDE